MFRKIFVGGILCSLMLFSQGWAELPAPQIIPTPQHWSSADGTTDLTGIQTILLGNGTGSADEFTAGLLRDAFQHQFKLNLNTVRESSGNGAGHAIILGNPDSTELVAQFTSSHDFTDSLMRQEGYILEINQGNILIAGLTPAGRFYGAMSVLQLIRTSDGTQPNLRISDGPALQFRGISDDISRGEVSTLDNFKQIIRFLAEYKMNTYMPYLEDLIQFDKYPAIGKNRGALSKAEIRELQQYASQYHVQIIPIFQTLGHYENILNMEPFVKYAEFPGASSLNTQNPKTYQFLTDLLDEVVPLFNSVYFHIGADESFDVGKGSSGAAVDRYDIATVHARHYKKVYDIVHKKYGKKVLMYGDIVLQNPTILNQIPDALIMMDWHYYATDNYPSTEVFAKAHQPFIVSPGIQNWRKFYPDQTSAWINIYNLTLEGFRDGALGSVTSNWGDYGGENLRELNYRGYSYAAECAWNPDGANGNTINQRFNLQFFGQNRVELENIENLLTQMTHHTDIKRIWQNPFYDTGDNTHTILVNSVDMQKNSSTVLELVDSIQPALTRHQEFLDYYRFIARFQHWFAETAEYAQWISNIAREYIEPEQRQPFTDTGIQWGTRLENEISDLAKTYRTLWLRTNVEANLQRLIALFDYQETYLDQMIEALRENRWNIPTSLSSQFIAAHGTDKDHVISTTYLRKTFQLPDKKIKHAYLQLVGYSQVELYLNGKSVGKVIATKTLSLWVENQRLRFWDVTSELNHKGINVLAAKAKSYNSTRPGAANIYLEIQYSDGSKSVIQSDAYWKSHTHPDGDWYGINYNDDYWLPVETVSYPWHIGAPIFDRGMPSRIDF